MLFDILGFLLALAIHDDVWPGQLLPSTSCSAIALAKQGHTVTLVDICQAELDRGDQHADSENATLEAIFCADASNVQETLPAF